MSSKGTSMDKSEMRRVLNDALRPMRTALSLNEWFVNLRVTHLDKSCAQCLADPDYSRATLSFDVEDFDGEKDLLESLLHELLHVMISEFEVYRKAVRPLVDSDAGWAAIEEVYIHACEVTVRRLEDMLTHGVSTTPRRLVTRGRKILNEME